MVYIALFGFLLAAGLVVHFLLAGEGKHYGRQGNDTNFPGGLML
jgi:hypothetical protein